MSASIDFEAAARSDLAAAQARGDAALAAVLDVILASGAALTLYQPAQDQFAVSFGDTASAEHLAVLVPGVGDDTNLCDDWIVWARNLYEAADSTAVHLWKGYHDPSDLADAALAELVCDDRADCGGRALAAFVGDLRQAEDQTITVVAHSFGSLVLGAALADHALECTNVVVVGSPGMNVESVRALHLERRQFYVERAPEDPVAGLGLLGSDPASPLFGGTWLATNEAGAVEVRGHSEYFEPGSEALRNIVRVVTGRETRAVRHRESLGDLAAILVVGSLTLPLRPIEAATRHYRGPGFRLLANVEHAMHLGANESGNLVRDAVNLLEQTAVGLVRRDTAGEAASR